MRLFAGVYSPQLDNQRDLYVYLPPSYAAGARRYPVIYAQDGQNLFDQASSYAGEWQIDETLEQLSREGIEAIVVGIANAGTARLDEYSAFRDERIGGGKGQRYLAFVAETVKPMVDQAFRTRPERGYTGILGSSMGGLISLYGFFHRPEVFGFAGVMSPSLWFANQSILAYVEQAAFAPGKIYLDVGTEETRNAISDYRLNKSLLERRMATYRRMQNLLIRKGYIHGRQLWYEEEPSGQHHEAAWARRLPGALRFLLAGLA